MVAGAGLVEGFPGSIWICGMRLSFSGWPLEKWNLHSADEKIRQNLLKHTLAPDWLCCDGNSCPACPRLYGVVIGQSCTFQGTQKYSQGGWVAARRSRPHRGGAAEIESQMPPKDPQHKYAHLIQHVPICIGATPHEWCPPPCHGAMP